MKISNLPLIAYSIIEAKKSKLINRVIVSSDDDEILNIAREYGAETPFKRPSNISKDDSPMIDVLKHALEHLYEKEENIDAILLLQPTSPFRNYKHIDDSIRLFRDSGATSVVSVVEVPHQYNPHSLMTLNKKGVLRSISQNVYSRRQEKPKYYARNGPAILIMDPSIIKKNELFGEKSIPYLMKIEDSLDIDTVEDLNEAKRRLEK